MVSIRVGKPSMEKQPWVASRKAKNFKEIKDITSYTQLEELKVDRFHLRRNVAIV